MNPLTHWNLSRRFDEARPRPGGTFECAATAWAESQEEPMTEADWVPVAEWTPLVDISEDDQGYMIKVDLPEVRREGLMVTAVDRRLTITGERRFEEGEKRRKLHLVERPYGNFARSFSVPAEADLTNLVFGFSDGVLTIHLGKLEATELRPLEIKVA